MTRKTLKKYMIRLVKEVKLIIRARLPKSFGLIIDGWSIGSDHYSGIFAMFTNEELQEVYNVADDFDEDTEFDTNLPESLKKVWLHCCRLVRHHGRCFSKKKKVIFNYLFRIVILIYLLKIKVLTKLLNR